MSESGGRREEQKVETFWIYLYCHSVTFVMLSDRLYAAITTLL